MAKGNKIRLIIWGLVWLVVLIAAILGIYEYYNGRGTFGKIRQELLPYVNQYNELNELDKYENAGIYIKAQYVKNGIKVNYKTSLYDIAYIFDYKDMQGTKVLYTKYNESNNSTAQIIIKEMLEAISVINGYNEGEIFNTISYNDLFYLSLDKGISIKNTNGDIEVYIDINKSIVEHLDDIDEGYITKNELSSINQILNEKNNFTFIKKNIIIYVEKTNESYVVYGQNTKYDDNLYKSIVNTINSLDLPLIIKNDFEMYYPSISTSKEFENYIITTDDTAENKDIFENKNNIIKIEILKEAVKKF